MAPLLDAWLGLAAAAWPYAALAAAVTWLALALAGRIGDASAKAYAVEQRVNLLRTTMLPAATQPGSVPPIPETWHDFPAGINAWGIGAAGWKKYRLLAEGSIEVSIVLTIIGTKTDGTAVFGSGALPPGYRTTTSKRIPVSTTSSGVPGANSTPWMGFLPDGSVNISGVNVSGLNEVHCHAVISLI